MEPDLGTEEVVFGVRRNQRSHPGSPRRVATLAHPGTGLARRQNRPGRPPRQDRAVWTLPD